MRSKLPRPSRRSGALFALALLAAPTASWSAVLDGDATPPPVPNYADETAWLCRPGRADACAAPTTATIVSPDGATRTETYKPDPAAPIDCFYVYPTVSRVEAAYAPVAETPWETGAVRDQFARFSAACRPFAPLYRQVTRGGLLSLFMQQPGVTFDLPYADVLAAWRDYLARDNHGRGVVLIGHSQGSILLARLIAEEIDGKPVASRLVSAIIPGTRVDVPPGEVVGGSFKATPLCTAATQTGCIIAYSSYLADRAVPPNAIFGATRTPGMRFACVDPAAVDGAPTLDADLPADASASAKAEYHTDFVALPGLLSATCRDDGRSATLAIAVPSGAETFAAADARERLETFADERPAWGLHGLDINLALGTLIDIVRKQTAVYEHR